MQPRRAVVPALGVAVLVAVGATAWFVLRADDSPVRGDLIAYSCKEPGNTWYAICVMKSDGSEMQRMTSRLTTTNPAWSPDGRRIAFTRNEDVGESTTFTDDDVFVMDADGDDPRQLTAEQEGRSSGQPTWSPDGGEIAFVRGQSVASVVPSRFGGLFVMRADGSDVRRLTPDPRGSADTSPAWSPDGREIAFTRGENLSSFDWKAAIYVMNRDGTGERLVLAHHFISDPYSLTWSPDGQTIAFETSPALECTAIHQVDVTSGRVRPVTSCTRKRDSALSPSWQPLRR